MAAERVLIGPSSFAEADPEPLRRLEASGVEVIPNPYRRKLTRPELLALLAGDVRGLIAGLEPLDREVLASSRLVVISRVGAGVSNVDLDAARELGIAVHSTPDGPTAAVAELTLGAMLALLRMIPRMDRALKEGNWEKRIGSQLEGRTVAIIGFGRIGHRVVELLRPFRVRLVVVDPLLTAPPEADITLLPLERALPIADVVTLHASGDACLLGEAELAGIKRGAYLLNAARGGIVDEEALCRALADGRLAGAWLDVFADEPYGGRLRELENVILTPHVGSYTAEGRRRMELEAVDNLLAVLRPPESVC